MNCGKKITKAKDQNHPNQITSPKNNKKPCKHLNTSILNIRTPLPCPSSLESPSSESSFLQDINFGLSDNSLSPIQYQENSDFETQLLSIFSEKDKTKSNAISNKSQISGSQNNKKQKHKNMFEKFENSKELNYFFLSSNEICEQLFLFESQKPTIELKKNDFYLKITKIRLENYSDKSGRILFYSIFSHKNESYSVKILFLGNENLMQVIDQRFQLAETTKSVEFELFKFKTNRFFNSLIRCLMILDTEDIPDPVQSKKKVKLRNFSFLAKEF